LIFFILNVENQTYMPTWGPISHDHPPACHRRWELREECEARRRGEAARQINKKRLESLIKNEKDAAVEKENASKFARLLPREPKQKLHRAEGEEKLHRAEGEVEACIQALAEKESEAMVIKQVLVEKEAVVYRMKVLRAPVLDMVVNYGVAKGMVLRRAIPLIIAREGWDYNIINWCSGTGGVSAAEMPGVRKYIGILPREIDLLYSSKEVEAKYIGR
jgi:hypothetical protein